MSKLEDDELPMKPTPYLHFKNGVLYQRWENAAYDSEWRKVPDKDEAGR